MGTRLVRLHLFACRISACLECETRKSLRTSQAMRVPSRKCNKNATWQPDSSVPDIRHASPTSVMPVSTLRVGVSLPSEAPLYRRRRRILPPPLGPHALLDFPPDLLNYLPVPPAARVGAWQVPIPPILVNQARLDAVAEPLHRLGRLVAAEAQIDARHVSEQLGRVAPPVVLELPGLARGEDGHDAVPVLGFELLRALDEDEAHRTRGVNVLHHARHVEHRGRRVVVWRHVSAVLEERLDVGHAQEGRGRWREEDDGVGPPDGLLVKGQRGVHGHARARRVRLARHKWLRELTDVREILARLLASQELVLIRGSLGAYCRLDSPQHGVPISHAPLPAVDLRQPGIQGPPSCARRR